MPSRFSILFALMAQVPAVAAEGPPDGDAPDFQIALTFDDLPYQTRRGGAPRVPDRAAQAATNQVILAALARAGARAAVFVNCGNLAADDGLLEAWRAAGHVIGNHTAHHSSAAHGPLDDWVKDMRACDGLWSPDDAATRWFRFPYLWRGETVARRDAVAEALKAGDYVSVPVTVDTHDWMFEGFSAKVYGQAGLPVPPVQSGPSEPPLAAALDAAFVANVRDALVEARAVSRDKLGREAVQIMLLHVNAVTARNLPAILDDIRAAGGQVVPVDVAMADPVFALPDAWAGVGARGWFARTDPTARPDGLPWYSDRETALQAQLTKLVEERAPR